MDVSALRNKLIELRLHGDENQGGLHGLANVLNGLMWSISACEYTGTDKRALLDQYGCTSLDELKEAMDSLKEELRLELSTTEFDGYFRDWNSHSGDELLRR